MQRDAGAIPVVIEPFPIDDGARLIDVLVAVGAAVSLNEARRLVAQGGIFVAGQRVDDDKTVLAVRAPALIRVGRRRQFVVVQREQSADNLVKAV